MCFVFSPPKFQNKWSGDIGPDSKYIAVQRKMPKAGVLSRCLTNARILRSLVGRTKNSAKVGD